MKKVFLFISTIISTSFSFSQTKYCSEIENEVIINKTYLTISYNVENKIPNYVGYYITYEHANSSVTDRESSFYSETSLPKMYRALSSDYTSSGYDRGHMSPAADWKFDKSAMHDSFSMINICPQVPNLNRIYWKDVESIERSYAYDCDTLYIISGEICSGNKYIKNHVGVPEYFYKTMVGVKNGDVVISIAWIFKNIKDKQEEHENRKTVDAIEDIIGHDLYCGYWFNDMNEDLIKIR